ncbi:MAG: anti-sigma factor antagonist [Tildeniella nuda ZEHNDER 1965/U140]|jgi:anti-sigma B factor antagonist|nr:anti-sigma factor antagonist [Tildeniella nuda ZEHNDER 1965/U140]
MDINIKNLQVTLLESETTVDDATNAIVKEHSSVNTINQVAIVELIGDIDGSTASTVQEQVLPLAQTGGRILLDLTQVPYMSSAGLRMLLSVYRQISSHNGQVILVGVSEEIRDTMSITGFLDFFTTRDTLDSGLEALKVKASLPT